MQPRSVGRTQQFALQRGVIDGSVLMLSAQLLVLCATLLGVEGYYEKMKEILKK
jgi:hypothetical protein